VVVTVCERVRCCSSIVAPGPDWPVPGDPQRVRGRTRGAAPGVAGEREESAAGGGVGRAGVAFAANAGAARVPRVSGSCARGLRGCAAARGEEGREGRLLGRGDAAEAGEGRGGAWRGAGGGLRRTAQPRAAAPALSPVAADTTAKRALRGGLEVSASRDPASAGRPVADLSPSPARAGAARTGPGKPSPAGDAAPGLSGRRREAGWVVAGI
jgi:hypothetical protein